MTVKKVKNAASPETLLPSAEFSVFIVDESKAITSIAVAVTENDFISEVTDEIILLKICTGFNVKLPEEISFAVDVNISYPDISGISYARTDTGITKHIKIITVILFTDRSPP